MTKRPRDRGISVGRKPAGYRLTKSRRRAVGRRRTASEPSEAHPAETADTRTALGGVTRPVIGQESAEAIVCAGQRPDQEG